MLTTDLLHSYICTLIWWNLQSTFSSHKFSRPWILKLSILRKCVLASVADWQTKRFLFVSRISSLRAPFSICLFSAATLLLRVWNGDWLLRVGGCDCECELTFFTLRLLEHRFISAVSQFFFFFLCSSFSSPVCSSSRNNMMLLLLFFFYLASFSLTKVKFMWAPPSLPFMHIFPMCDMRSGIWKRRGDSVDFTKVDL